MNLAEMISTLSTTVISEKHVPAHTRSFMNWGLHSGKVRPQEKGNLKPLMNFNSYYNQIGQHVLKSAEENQHCGFLPDIKICLFKNSILCVMARVASLINFYFWDLNLKDI